MSCPLALTTKNLCHGAVSINNKITIDSEVDFYYFFYCLSNCINNLQVVLLECLRKEAMLPKDVLSHFNTAFAYAKQGSVKLCRDFLY